MKSILDTQMNVSYGIWNGRIHVTMATDSLEKVKPMVVLTFLLQISSSGVELSLSPYMVVTVPPLLAIPQKSLSSSVMKIPLSIKRKLNSLFRPGHIVECVVIGDRPGRPNRQQLTVSLIGQTNCMLEYMYSVCVYNEEMHCAM